MFRSTMLATIAGLTAALCVTVKFEESRVRAAQADVAVLALQASNLEAERDSSRDVSRENRRVAMIIGDSLRVMEKQVIQVVQRRDGLDRALSRERIALYALTTTVDSVRLSASATPSADSAHGLRQARFDVRQEPFTLAAQVEIPAPPDTARLSVQVALDAIPVLARLTCSPPDERGIRRASILTTTPQWASIRFDRVEQSPELCSSMGHRREARRHRFLDAVPLVIGAGRVVTLDGRGFWGFLLGIGTMTWG